MGTGSSSSCNSFGLAGLEVPSIKSHGRPGLPGTQAGRSKLICLRVILCDEIRRALACEVALPWKASVSLTWRDERCRRSHSAPQRCKQGSIMASQTPKTRTDKFCFPQISQQQHFTLPLQAVSDWGPTLLGEGIIRRGGNGCCYRNASIGLTTVSWERKLHSSSL